LEHLDIDISTIYILLPRPQHLYFCFPDFAPAVQRKILGTPVFRLKVVCFHHSEDPMDIWQASTVCVQVRRIVFTFYRFRASFFFL